MLQATSQLGGVAVWLTYAVAWMGVFGALADDPADSRLCALTVYFERLACQHATISRPFFRRSERIAVWTDPLSRTAQSGKLLPLLRDPLGIRVAGAGGGRTGFGIENKE